MTRQLMEEICWKGQALNPVSQQDSTCCHLHCHLHCHLVEVPLGSAVSAFRLHGLFTFEEAAAKVVMPSAP